MRPKYESARNVETEAAVISKLSERFGMKAEKLPEFSQVDFALSRHGVVWGVAEVKVRNKHYDQMFISLHKVQALRELHAAGLQARIVFATPEGLFVKKIETEIDGWIGLGGRSDRGDKQDRELVVYFGDLVINGNTVKEEKQPMQRICESDPAWF